MNQELKQKILNYSKKYYNDFLKPIEPQREKMFADSWIGLEFFLDRVFYRGRADRISDRVKDIAKQILSNFVKGKYSNFDLFDAKNHKELRQRLEKVIGKGKVGAELDIDLIISLLDFASKIKENNLVLFLKDRFKPECIKGLYCDLQNIKGIGPKIASFILRDFSVLYNLENHLSENDYIVLQPVDVWVRRVGLLLGLYDSLEEIDERVRMYIVEYCISQKLSPPRFNQGMWYYGFSERP